jgi:5-methylthioribose kinase
MITLNASEPKQLATYLQEKHWLKPDERIISLSKPGEGNMNYVLRVTTENRTFIVKQSRSYVEKYPSVLAPKERVITESKFYEKIATNAALQQFMPKLIGVDTESNVMVIEDLGNSTDFTFLYDDHSQINEKDLNHLMDYLHILHHSFIKQELDNELNNIELRKLNHEHIFIYPFMEENGFDLNAIQNGLQTLAIPYKTDVQLKEQIATLGNYYLSNGHYLLHGDYYPGSWLKTDKGLKVIDPEFCFFGLREFDLGVLKAHLYLTQQNETSHQIVQSHYEAYTDLDTCILNGFTGVEMMRRLIGLAQLPLQMDLHIKHNLLQLARTLILK